MTEQEDCVHHWKIESPNGNAGWSTGKCIKCQGKRQFNNVNPDAYSSWVTQKQQAGSKVGS